MKQIVAKSSPKLSPKLVINPSPKFSLIPADPQKNHPVGWNKKWQNCHMNFHQIRWSYHHLNYHQFWQIPPKITIMGDIKSDKIVTRIVTKFGDIFVTLTLTILGSSPKKITILGETISDKIVTQSVTKFGDNFVTSILTNSGNSPKFSPGWVTILPKIR